MKLVLLTTLTMIAFAANSVLNRLALTDGAIGAADFAAVRAISAAVLLVALVALRDRARPNLAFDPVAAGALCLYLVGFSFAYVSLDAGLGALVLFGGVQLVMFGGALLAREPIPMRRSLGAGIAFVGLIVLLAPGTSQAPLWAVAMMVAAAVGWGVYSLIGRGAVDPLAATGANFLWAVPGAVGVWLPWPGADAATGTGYLLAILSGAITSGLGYALWYSVLPALGATRAAAAQLTVPVIAALGGLLFLGEVVTLQFVIAAVLVLGGVALSMGR